jgi:hypothetical protein
MYSMNIKDQFIQGRTLTQTSDGQRRSFPLAVGVGEGKDEAERGGEGKERSGEREGGGKDELSVGRLGVADAAGTASLAWLQGRDSTSLASTRGGFGWSPEKN